MFEQGAGGRCDVGPARVTPLLYELADAVDVPAFLPLLLDGIEQARRGFLFWRSNGEEVTATTAAGVDGVRDLIVRVKAEMARRLKIGRVQDRVVNDHGLHGLWL